MFLSIRYVLLICGLLISIGGNAQKFTEGVFEYGLISYEVPKDSVAVAELTPLIKQLTSIPKVIFYYTSDCLAVINEEPSGLTRGVVDLKTNKEYSFSEISGIKSFTVNDFDPKIERSIPINAEFGEGKHLDEKILGLNCTEYSTTRGRMSTTLITTKDMLIPEGTVLNSMVIKEGFAVSTELIDSTTGLSYSIGMKSFSPKISDRSVFSIDTTGMTNTSSFLEEFQEGIMEMAQNEAEKSAKFKNEKPPVADKELIQKMVDQGILDIEVYSVSNALEGKELSDIPSLLIETSRKEKGFALMDKNEMKERFAACDLLTESLEKLLTLDDSEWNKIDEYYRMDVIVLAIIKDHLSSQKAKKQIIENLDRLNYGNFIDSESGKSYLNGRIDLKSFLGTLPFLDELDIRTAKNEEDLFQQINTFFSTAFNSLSLDVKITKNKNVIVLESGIYVYYVDLLNMKEKLKNPRGSEFEINLQLYSYLLDYVKQISKDNNRSLSFKLYRLGPPFTTRIISYSTIIEDHPDLKIDQEALYFYTTPFNNIIDELIGTSFSYHPKNSFVWEINLGSFQLRASSGKEYVSTKTKNKFINYITEHHKEFGLNEKTLSSLVEELTTTIFPDKNTLLTYLPNRKLVFDDNGYFKPTFPQDKNNDFKNIFPHLYKVIGDDFQAINFKYDPDANRIHFTYNGQQQTIRPGTENMVNFIEREFKKNTSGKQLYKVIYPQFPNTEYFYLTPQQKKDISEIIPINF